MPKMPRTQTRTQTITKYAKSAKPNKPAKSKTLAAMAGQTAATPPMSFPEALARAPKPAGRREQILHAAVEVLNSEGFGALTQTHVAERAGVRQSHVTYYFPARNDLLRETAAYGFDAMLGALALGIESGELNYENFREVMNVDIHDRRFARLMSALIVASDEDAQIKPWLANFEAANLEHLKRSFHKLGLPVTLDEVAFFHATYVGAVILDLGESTDESLTRAQRKVMMAFDAICVGAKMRAQMHARTRGKTKATHATKPAKTKATSAAKGKKKS
jgi:AcrR family transcriptional regulator